MPHLLKDGEFRSHSGLTLPFKIDCDALTDDDLDTLAHYYSKYYIFSQVFGVPKGGMRFASALGKYRVSYSLTILLAEDVVTTGASIQELKGMFAPWLQPRIQGVAIFARGTCPSWVTPIFTLNDPSLRVAS